MENVVRDEKSLFRRIGASNHMEGEREQNDYYATEPYAAELLCDLWKFSPFIWECACGEGHLAKVFERRGYVVKSTDLIDRGFGEGGIDFLQYTKHFRGDIITNPPYKHAQDFVEKALSLISDGHHVAMLLKLTFMEGKKRRKLFEENPPKVIYVSSSRLLCAKNGNFEKMKENGGGVLAYAWYIWKKGYHGDTIVKWCN